MGFNVEHTHRKSMLNFFPPGMAERYLLFTFVAVLGVLQLIAARCHWAGLSLPGRQRRRWGYVLGAGLLGGAYLWFFGTLQPLIFQPGLAGTELFTVFAVSTLLAIAATLGLTSVLHRSTEPQPELTGERVEFDPGRGTIQRAADVGRGPAAIVVSDFPDGDFPVSRLSDKLVDQGVLVLNIDLATDDPVEYPAVLARLPAACAHLQGRSDVNGQEILLIGVGIGGDLVLRTAATDLSVRAAAVDPVLTPQATGLDLLRRATVWEALRWDGLRRRLAEALAAVDRLPQLEDRPALLVYRGNPTPPGEVAAGDAEVAVVGTNEEAVQRVVRWAAEVTTLREHVA